MTADEVRELLKEECERVGGLRKWASAHKISVSYVSRVISGEKEPSDAICKALDLKREVFYRVKR